MILLFTTAGGGERWGNNKSEVFDDGEDESIMTVMSDDKHGLMILLFTTAGGGEGWGALDEGGGLCWEVNY